MILSIIDNCKSSQVELFHLLFVEIFVEERGKLVLSVVGVGGAQGCDVGTEEENDTEQDVLVRVLQGQTTGLAGLQMMRTSYLRPATNIPDYV